MPTGFSGVPPPGPAIPVSATPTSAPSRSRTPSAIACATSADTAPCSSSSTRGHLELGDLDVVRVRDDPTQEDVARPWNRRQELGDEPARARLGRRQGQTARPAFVQDDLGDRPLVLGEQVLGELVAQKAGGKLLPVPDQVDVDLEVPGADGRLHPALLAAGLREHARDCGLAHAVEAQRAPLRRLRRASTRRTGSLSTAFAHSRCSSFGGPGSATATHEPVSRTSPGAVPARPSDALLRASDACLVTPGANSP